MTSTHASNALHRYASTQKAKILSSFFKTGPGEYGHGDVFIGVKVPEIRVVARSFHALAIPETLNLLHSPVHEERLLAILILISQYNEGSLPVKESIVSLYLKNTYYINNWDLIDLSAHKLLGNILKNRPRNILDQLARSLSLWERRIAIVSTFAFIRDQQFSDTLRIADILIPDDQDLIHKASGWMLREVGKRDTRILESFLLPRYRKMPRTMLRYAIEKFSKATRKQYLEGEI